MMLLTGLVPQHSESLVPEGPHAIAAMRLLCMAQAWKRMRSEHEQLQSCRRAAPEANGRTIVDAFNQELSSEDFRAFPS